MNPDDRLHSLAIFPRSNPYPVLEFAADASMLYCNEAAHRMAQSLGEPTVLPILPPHTPAIITHCLLSRENTLNLTSTLKNRTIAWSFIPIAETNTVHCYANEITERLQLEAQLRHSVKMEAVGQLAAGVAHDFNNILTVIQGHADLLLQGGDMPARADGSLRQICAAAARAAKLVQQLLLFSRKQVMQTRKVDLDAIISNIGPMLQRLLGESIEFEFSPTPGLPAVIADSGMIEQVLANLSVNSRDAMPKGGRLSVTLSQRQLDPVASIVNPEARPGQFVCLTVADTGCGMNQGVLNHLFEPFFTTKEVGKGTGLGLATVYGIVKQHQGWITVESKPGAGSQFTLFFPSAGKETDTAVAPPSEFPLAAARREATILVAEDEPALRELVVSILELCGYHVYQAATGVEAVKVWRQHKEEIDLLLTDMVMPQGMTGRQLAEQLQAENPKLKVIYTSGYTPGISGKDIAMLEGFNFLPKPYPPGRLAKLVRECLDAPDPAPRTK
jgi:two-component system, cell cycle sensor histidine kinase and response regulator CckA